MVHRCKRGLRLGVAGYQAKGFSWSPNVGHVYKEIKPGVYGTKWGMIQTHADVMLNFTNLFLGYKENRVYNAIPYASISYLRGVDQSKENELGVGLGFINSFRVSNALNINLELRATAVNDHMDGIVGGKNYEATTAVLVGVSYKLGKKGWNRPNQVSGEEIAAVQSRLKEMPSGNFLPWDFSAMPFPPWQHIFSAPVHLYAYTHLVCFLISIASFPKNIRF